VGSNIAYSLTVADGTGMSTSAGTSLSKPLELTLGAGAGDVGTVASGSAVALGGSGTVVASSATTSAADGDVFTQTFTQPVTYADPAGSYSATVTYTASSAA
jgi:hypothetical protein